MAEVAQSQQPVTPPGTESQVADHRLQKAHRLLVENYVRILKEVSELHFLGGRGYNAEQWGGDFSVSRVLVRLFCEAHIRRMLTVLSRVYQLQQGLNGLGTGQKGFLEEEHKSCERILSAIPSRQGVKLVFASASPVALGLFVASLGVENTSEALVKVASPEFRARIGASTESRLLIGYSALAIVYLLFFFAGSFAYKRGMFFPAVRYREKTRWSRRQLEKYRQLRNLKEPSDGINIYELEDKLFDELAFTKPREPRIDIFIALGTAIAGLLAWFLYAVTAGRQEDSSEIVFVSIVFAALGLAVIVRAVQIGYRRKCR